MVKPRDRFETARNGLPFSRVLDEVFAVNVDNAVAVKDDQLHDAVDSSDMSLNINRERGNSQSRPFAVRRTWNTHRKGTKNVKKLKENHLKSS